MMLSTARSRHGTARLTNALNSTPHTLRMDITDIPDSKVVTECGKSAVARSTGPPQPGPGQLHIDPNRSLL